MASSKFKKRRFFAFFTSRFDKGERTNLASAGGDENVTYRPMATSSDVIFACRTSSVGDLTEGVSLDHVTSNFRMPPSKPQRVKKTAPLRPSVVGDNPAAWYGVDSSFDSRATVSAGSGIAKLSAWRSDVELHRSGGQTVCLATLPVNAESSSSLSGGRSVPDVRVTPEDGSNARLAAPRPRPPPRTKRKSRAPLPPTFQTPRADNHLSRDDVIITRSNQHRPCQFVAPPPPPGIPPSDVIMVDLSTQVHLTKRDSLTSECSRYSYSSSCHSNDDNHGETTGRLSDASDTCHSNAAANLPDSTDTARSDSPPVAELETLTTSTHSAVSNTDDKNVPDQQPETLSTIDFRLSRDQSDIASEQQVGDQLREDVEKNRVEVVDNERWLPTRVEPEGACSDDVENAELLVGKLNFTEHHPADHLPTGSSDRLSGDTTTVAVVKPDIGQSGYLHMHQDVKSKDISRFDESDVESNLGDDNKVGLSSTEDLVVTTTDQTLNLHNNQPTNATDVSSVNPSVWNDEEGPLTDLPLPRRRVLAEDDGGDVQTLLGDQPCSVGEEPTPREHSEEGGKQNHRTDAAGQSPGEDATENDEAVVVPLPRRRRISNPNNATSTPKDLGDNEGITGDGKTTELDVVKTTSAPDSASDSDDTEILLPLPRRRVRNSKLPETAPERKPEVNSGSSNSTEPGGSLSRSRSPSPENRKEPDTILDIVVDFSTTSPAQNHKDCEITGENALCNQDIVCDSLEFTSATPDSQSVHIDVSAASESDTEDVNCSRSSYAANSPGFVAEDLSPVPHIVTDRGASGDVSDATTDSPSIPKNRHEISVDYLTVKRGAEDDTSSLSDDSFAPVIRGQVQGFLDSFKPVQVEVLVGTDEDLAVDEILDEGTGTGGEEELEDSLSYTPYSAEKHDKFYFGTYVSPTTSPAATDGDVVEDTEPQQRVHYHDDRQHLTVIRVGGDNVITGQMSNANSSTENAEKNVRQFPSDAVLTSGISNDDDRFVNEDATVTQAVEDDVNSAADNKFQATYRHNADNRTAEAPVSSDWTLSDDPELTVPLPKRKTAENPAITDTNTDITKHNDCPVTVIHCSDNMAPQSADESGPGHQLSVEGGNRKHFEPAGMAINVESDRAKDNNNITVIYCRGSNDFGALLDQSSPDFQLINRQEVENPKYSGTAFADNNIDVNTHADDVLSQVVHSPEDNEPEFLEQNVVSKTAEQIVDSPENSGLPAFVDNSIEVHTTADADRGSLSTTVYCTDTGESARPVPESPPDIEQNTDEAVELCLTETTEDPDKVDNNEVCDRSHSPVITTDGCLNNGPDQNISDYQEASKRTVVRPGGSDASSDVNDLELIQTADYANSTMLRSIDTDASKSTDQAVSPEHKLEIPAADTGESKVRQDSESEIAEYEKSAAERRQQLMLIRQKFESNSVDKTSDKKRAAVERQTAQTSGSGIPVCRSRSTDLPRNTATDVQGHGVQGQGNSDALIKVNSDSNNNSKAGSSPALAAVTTNKDLGKVGMNIDAGTQPTTADSTTTKDTADHFLPVPDKTASGDVNLKADATQRRLDKQNWQRHKSSEEVDKTVDKKPPVVRRTSELARRFESLAAPPVTMVKSSSKIDEPISTQPAQDHQRVKTHGKPLSNPAVRPPIGTPNSTSTVTAADGRQDTATSGNPVESSQDPNSSASTVTAGRGLQFVQKAKSVVLVERTGSVPSVPPQRGMVDEKPQDHESVQQRRRRLPDKQAGPSGDNNKVPGQKSGIPVTARTGSTVKCSPEKPTLERKMENASGSSEDKESAAEGVDELSRIRANLRSNVVRPTSTSYHFTSAGVSARPLPRR